MQAERCLLISVGKKPCRTARGPVPIRTDPVTAVFSGRVVFMARGPLHGPTEVDMKVNGTTICPIRQERCFCMMDTDMRANGERYKGQWENGLKDGHGEMIFADGKKYNGEWKNGMMHGKGVLFFTDGSRYEGEWTENRLTGRGSLIFWDGKIHKGEWKEHEFKVLEVL
jgi:hypothetical protein